MRAQTVMLQGMLGAKALLIVDGAAPRSVAAGDSHQGVKVVSTAGDQAVVEIGGKRHTLRVGEAPASVGGSRRRGGAGQQDRADGRHRRAFPGPGRDQRARRAVSWSTRVPA